MVKDVIMTEGLLPSSSCRTRSSLGFRRRRQDFPSSAIERERGMVDHPLMELSASATTCSAADESPGTLLQLPLSAKDAAEEWESRRAQVLEEARPSRTASALEQVASTHMHDMKKAWESGDKVEALKITIQAAKLLGDIGHLQSYPAHFMRVTRVIDTFGKLVFERIKAKAEESPDTFERAPPKLAEYKRRGGAGPLPAPPRAHKLPENFGSQHISPLPQELCRNWFYKIACIRGLIPRIAVEIGLLPCYRFLCHSEGNEISHILDRLGPLLRGLGEPMLLLYMQAYLAASGAVVAPGYYRHIAPLIEDYFYVFKLQIEGQLTNYAVPEEVYIDLQAPALDCLLSCAGAKRSPEVSRRIYGAMKNSCESLQVLTLVLQNCDFVSCGVATSEEILKEIIVAGDRPSAVSRSKAIALLGDQLLQSLPEPSVQLKLLEQAWPIVRGEESPSKFLLAAAPWLEMAPLACAKESVVSLLEEVHSKVVQAKGSEARPCFEDLNSLLLRLARKHTRWQFSLLSSPAVQQLVQVLEDTVCCTSAVALASRCLSVPQGQATANPKFRARVALNYASVAAGGVDVLTPAHEREGMEELFRNLISSVQFDCQDLQPEEKLVFLQDIRSSLPYACIQSLAKNIIMATMHLLAVPGAPPTLPFAADCLYFVSSTLPYVYPRFHRISILTLASLLAGRCGLVPQSDALMCECVSIASSSGRETANAVVVPQLQSMLSAIVAVPPNPDLGYVHHTVKIAEVAGRGLLGCGPRVVDLLLSGLSVIASRLWVVQPYCARNSLSSAVLLAGEQLLPEVDAAAKAILGILSAVLPTFSSPPTSLELDMLNVMQEIFDLSPSSAEGAGHRYTAVLLRKAKLLEQESATAPHICRYASDTLRRAQVILAADAQQ